MAVLSDRAIRALRPARPTVDPWQPLAVSDEQERGLDGRSHSCRTVFIAGAECPFTCVYCDLWQYTTEQTTPLGAVPRQLQLALADYQPGTIERLKIYNASNFFDSRAVPAADHEAIATHARGFERVVVECHPRLIDERCRRFQERLDGSLELAIGLETAHPTALEQLNKQMTVSDFATATERARSYSIPVRAFVLIGVPWLPAGQQLDWLGRTIRTAIELGAQRVTMIPVRGGNGALEALAAEGFFVPPDLALIEAAQEVGLVAQSESTVVSLDLWDLERFAAAPCCSERRIARLCEIEQLGSLHQAPPIVCTACTEPDR